MYFVFFSFSFLSMTVFSCFLSSEFTCPSFSCSFGMKISEQNNIFLYFLFTLKFWHLIKVSHEHDDEFFFYCLRRKMKGTSFSLLRKLQWRIFLKNRFFIQLTMKFSNLSLHKLPVLIKLLIKILIHIFDKSSV